MEPQEETTLSVVKRDTPQALMSGAMNVADACRQIVMTTACNIQGKKYVKVEGWQAIAVAHGCVASARDVERIEGGYRAIGEIRKMDTGDVIATAEGFVGDDEMWAKRPEYARRAMAQTRAISRAARSAFAHVVVMIDSGLSTTPAEEVPYEGFDAKPSDSAEDEFERAVPARAPAPAKSQQDAPWSEIQIHFGKNKGKTLGELEEKSAQWYFHEWQPKPYQGKVSREDAELRFALDAMGVEKGWGMDDSDELPM